MKKAFIICPVRNATPEVKKKLENYVRRLERKGYQVHYPPRDTDQNDPIGNQICERNFKAILEADEIHVWYDENSTGVYFDLGGTFMLIQILGYKKKIVFINRDKVPYNPGKSFQKVLRFLEEQTSKRAKPKTYKIWKNGRIIQSRKPGRFAGIKTMMIFGRLDCKSGMRAKKENRIFLHTWEDAVETGYRPCKLCKPQPNDRYERKDGKWQRV